MTRVPIRGGNWNNGANDGLGALNLNNARSNSNVNIGFRPALFPIQMRQAHGPAAGVGEKRSHAPSLSWENIYRHGRPVGIRRRPPRADFIRGKMAKTHNDLMPKIYDFENLMAAYSSAVRGKRYHHSALEFGDNLEEHIIGRYAVIGKAGQA